MNWLLTVPIRAYRRWVPVERRRPCLFPESCSEHVLRVTTEAGLMAGLRALLIRVRQCRPDQAPVTDPGTGRPGPDPARERVGQRSGA